VGRSTFFFTVNSDNPKSCLYKNENDMLRIFHIKVISLLFCLLKYHIWKVQILLFILCCCIFLINVSSLLTKICAYFCKQSSVHNQVTDHMCSIHGTGVPWTTKYKHTN